MGEIPAHSDTSLLTPPICIFSPLGNSGGQIKQVCSGLWGKKEPPNHHFCVLKWKWHHPLTATLTCLCFTSHRNVGQSVKEKKKKKRTTSFWGRCLIHSFSVLDVQKQTKKIKKKKKNQLKKENRHSCNQVAGANSSSLPGTWGLVSFLCLSTLSWPAEPRCVAPRTGRTPYRELRVM